MKAISQKTGNKSRITLKNHCSRPFKTLYSLSPVVLLFFFATSVLILNSGCGKKGKNEVISCTTDADCQTGYVCQNGQCVQEQAGSCTTDADCHTGQICQDGQCVQQQTGTCTTDADCQSGQICQNGSCVAQQQDTTPPDTTITSYPSDPTNSTSATFEFSSSESGSTFECQLDAGGWSSCTSSKKYNDLTEGSHTFEVKAIDSAGNIDPTPADYTWTVIYDTWNIPGGLSPVPSARAYHTAVWTGSEMIVWGGYDGSNYFNTGVNY